jgi:hypothetical protein
MTQTCEIKTRLTLLTKSFCSRMGIQTTPLDAALRLSDAEVVKDLYQLWLEAGHEGTLDDFLLTFKGDQGDSNYQLWLDDGNEGTLEDFFATLHGKDIELRLSETHIQWKYVQDGEETWTNLIAREDLKGDEIQIGVTETHIIWKYSNETIWNNLIALAEITGPQGEAVMLQANATHIQWKYESDADWTDLVALDDITGADGVAGIDGVSIVWQGSLAAAPESPSLNWGYYNTAEGKSYIWDGDSWEMIAQDGTDGVNGQGVPIGGTTGQVLVKKSDTDYDVEWVTLT